MAESTPKYGLEYPSGADPVVVAGDMKNLAESTVQALDEVSNFKRGVAASDNASTLATSTERGEYNVFATAQATRLGLPTIALGFVENKPDRDGTPFMQTQIAGGSSPRMFARTVIGGEYLPWDSLGFVSIKGLRDSAKIDDLVTGKSYPTYTGATAEALDLPSSGAVSQNGFLDVLGKDDGFSGTVGETQNVLLRWTTLSATPGIFLRAKINGSWREWVRVDAGAVQPTAGGGLPGQVSVWGSSTPEGVVPEMSEALREYGVQVHQKSSGGEWSGQTAARIGASSITLTPAGGSIPASGAVTVTSGGFIDGDPVNLLQPLTGWLGGVHGTLAGIGNLATGRYEFTRTTPGAAISMASGAWVPEVKTPAHLNIFAAGKNDLNVGRTAAHLTKVIARRDQAVAYWRSRNQDFLILGHFVNIGTPASDAGRTQIEADNADAKAKYPNNFIDMQELLAGTELWEWTGITPTPEDLAQQALGNMPPSIQGSGNHLNTAGDQYLSHKIIQWMIGRKYISEGRVPFSVFSQQKVKESAGRTVHVWDPINQREQLIYGHTGVRDVSALVTGLSGQMLLSRDGNNVTLEFNNVSPTSAERTDFMYLPQGFRIGRTTYRWLQATTGGVSRSFQLYASGNSRINAADPSDIYRQSFTFPTLDPWPTSLPGSAA